MKPQKLLMAAFGLLALAAGVLICGHLLPDMGAHTASTVGEESKVVHLDDSNFRPTLQSSDTIVVVDFYATWCKPCDWMSPHIEKLAREFDGRVLVVKLDVDAARKTASEEGIRRLPTLKIYSPGGDTVLESTIGYKDYKALKELVEKHLNVK